MNEDKKKTDFIIIKIKKIIKEIFLTNEQKLPNERALSNLLKCNRSIIRNALLILEDRGYIFRKVGSGTYINRSNTQISLNKKIFILEKNEQSSFYTSIEARLSIEPLVCSLASSNIDLKEKKILGEKLNQIKKSKIWSDLKINTYNFFLFIYEQSKNKYYINLFKELIEDRKKTNFDGHFATKYINLDGKVSKIFVINSYNNLRKIHESIVGGNNKEAFKINKEYLTNILAYHYL